MGGMLVETGRGYLSRPLIRTANAGLQGAAVAGQSAHEERTSAGHAQAAPRPPYTMVQCRQHPATVLANLQMVKPRHVSAALPRNTQLPLFWVPTLGLVPASHSLQPAGLNHFTKDATNRRSSCVFNAPCLLLLLFLAPYIPLACSLSLITCSQEPSHL